METINNSRTAVRDTKKAQLKKKRKKKKKKKRKSRGCERAEMSNEIAGMENTVQSQENTEWSLAKGQMCIFYKFSGQSHLSCSFPWSLQSWTWC